MKKWTKAIAAVAAGAMLIPLAGLRKHSRRLWL